MTRPEGRIHIRSRWPGVLACLALGLLIAAVPVEHPAHALDEIVHTETVGAAPRSAEVHRHHVHARCHAASSCVAAAIVTEGVVTEGIASGRRRAARPSRIGAGRPVQPDMKPPIF